MIALSPVIDKLKSAGLLRVQGVLEYGATTAPPSLLPAFYVVPDSEEASPNRLSGIIDQRVVATFQVIVVVGARAANPDRPSDELTQALRAVKEALIGWMIPGAASPTEYAGGRLITAAGQIAAHALRFRTAYHERTALQ